MIGHYLWILVGSDSKIMSDLIIFFFLECEKSQFVRFCPVHTPNSGYLIRRVWNCSHTVGCENNECETVVTPYDLQVHTDITPCVRTRTGVTHEYTRIIQVFEYTPVSHPTTFWDFDSLSLEVWETEEGEHRFEGGSYKLNRKCPNMVETRHIDLWN